MKRDRLRNCDANCRCGLEPARFRRTVADIENRVFQHIRDVMASPRGCDFAFHFALLDSYYHGGEAVSRGHDPAKVSPERASNYEHAVGGAIAVVKASGDEMNVVNILRALAAREEVWKAAIEGFHDYFSLEGQPLAEQPSRFEQCLAIRTACDHYKCENLEKIRPFPKLGVLVVEDYLGDCEELTAAYDEALRHLGMRPDAHPLTRSEEPICTPETAPFLVAEHLQLYGKRPQPFLEWLAELEQEPIGLALVPIRLLGQYRAGGVWLFQGKFQSDENRELRAHLQETATSYERWLANTIGSDILQSTSILFLRSLAEFKELTGTPLSECGLARRALSSLWYTTGPTELKRSGGEISEETPWHVGPRSGLAQEIAVKVAFGDNVTELLGFDMARCTCPFIPVGVDLGRELNHVVEVFRDISSAAASVHRTDLRVREAYNRQLSITAHDYVNGLEELLWITGAQGDDGPDAAVRLDIAHSIADGLLGHAWVVRGEAKRSDDTVNRTRLIKLKFRAGGPDAGDLEFWRDYLFREALFIAYSAMRREARAQSGRFAGSLLVRYRFAGQTGDGTQFGSLDWEELRIGNDALAAYTGRQLSSRLLPWPLPPEAKDEKLQELGQRAVMMWGARELVRNACGRTAVHASTRTGEWPVDIDVDVRPNPGGVWTFRVSVSNPWPSLKQQVPTVWNISKWPTEIRKVLSQAQFADDAKQGTATYVYKLEIRDANP